MLERRGSRQRQLDAWACALPVYMVFGTRIDCASGGQRGVPLWTPAREPPAALRGPKELVPLESRTFKDRYSQRRRDRPVFHEKTVREKLDRPASKRSHPGETPACPRSSAPPYTTFRHCGRCGRPETRRITPADPCNARPRPPEEAARSKLKLALRVSSDGMTQQPHLLPTPAGRDWHGPGPARLPGCIGCAVLIRTAPDSPVPQVGLALVPQRKMGPPLAPQLSAGLRQPPYPLRLSHSSRTPFSAVGRRQMSFQMALIASHHGLARTGANLNDVFPGRLAQWTGTRRDLFLGVPCFGHAI
jgi:hypothetical protein